ncbi:hypothetical protein GGR56DRAFT_632788 [Xylariaceae sp. FL0804]|nr:hypothetical protein GGR56DRAFT_632788 [Xylariaceae sp. FL0804]
MASKALEDRLGSEIEDPEEETFLLFARDLPSSQDLGFVDSGAAALELTVAGRDFTIHQSPTVLHRPGSTTGAVVWRVTPLVAAWLATPAATNPLWASGALSASSRVLELGCGASALVGLALAPLVGRYVLTDQAYVARLVERNLEQNSLAPAAAAGSPRHAAQKKRKARSAAAGAEGQKQQRPADLRFEPLDWELDEVTPALAGPSAPEGGAASAAARGFDAVIACDCIYNDSLIGPLVSTCVDACRLRASDDRGAAGDVDQPPATVCLVAQQLRDPEIFEAWIKEFNRHFRVWRVPDEGLSPDLRASPGFVVHVGVLRDK